MVNRYTFSYNVKYSLLILLCTLTLLCKGTLLQPLRLDFFEWTFPLVLAQKLRLSLFRTEQGERRADHMNALFSPTYQTHIPRIHRQGKLQAALRHSTLPHTAGGFFSFRFAKYFLLSITLFFHCYLYHLSWSYQPL